MYGTTDPGRRLERDLAELAHQVQDRLNAALDGLDGRPSGGEGPLRARIGDLQEEVGRRALRLMAARSVPAGDRRLAEIGFNQSVLLAALADCATAIDRRAEAASQRERSELAPITRAARSCLQALPAADPRRIEDLDAAIARVRGRSSRTAAAARVLEQIGELVDGLQQVRRRAAA